MVFKNLTPTNHNYYTVSNQGLQPLTVGLGY